MPYRRKLSPIERLHAAIGMRQSELEPQRVLAFVLEGRGELDAERLRAAVERAAAANPGSRAVLHGHLARARWEARPDSGPGVRVVEASTWDGRGSEGAEAVLGARLALRDGPTCEVVLLPGDPCRVVLRVLHAVMDGGGLILFAQDVFRCLRGQEPVGAASTTTDVEVMATIESGRVPLVWRRWLQPTGAPKGRELGDVWQRVELPGGHARLLPRVALAAARFARRQGDGPVRFGIPVDLRRHAPGVRSTANLTGLVLLDVPPDASERSLIQALREEIARGSHAALPRIAHATALVPLRILEHAVSRRRRTYLTQHRFKLSGMITDTGRLSFGDYTADGFRPTALFGLPIPDNFFATLTVDDSGAHMTLGMPRLFASGGRLAEICRFIAEDVGRAQER